MIDKTNANKQPLRYEVMPERNNLLGRDCFQLGFRFDIEDDKGRDFLYDLFLDPNINTIESNKFTGKKKLTQEEKDQYGKKNVYVGESDYTFEYSNFMFEKFQKDSVDEHDRALLMFSSKESRDKFIENLQKVQEEKGFKLEESISEYYNLSDFKSISDPTPELTSNPGVGGDDNIIQEEETSEKNSSTPEDNQIQKFDELNLTLYLHNSNNNNINENKQQGMFRGIIEKATDTFSRCIGFAGTKMSNFFKSISNTFSSDTPKESKQDDVKKNNYKP